MAGQETFRKCICLCLKMVRYSNNKINYWKKMKIIEVKFKLWHLLRFYAIHYNITLISLNYYLCATFSTKQSYITILWYPRKQMVKVPFPYFPFFLKTKYNLRYLNQSYITKVVGWPVAKRKTFSILLSVYKLVLVMNHICNITCLALNNNQ
jgi:hypothetical protein